MLTGSARLVIKVNAQKLMKKSAGKRLEEIETSIESGVRDWQLIAVKEDKKGKKSRCISNDIPNVGTTFTLLIGCTAVAPLTEQWAKVDEWVRNGSFVFTTLPYNYRKLVEVRSLKLIFVVHKPTNLVD
jgi:hypothetical protein